jgi:hypothetical protein
MPDAIINSILERLFALQVPEPVPYVEFHSLQCAGNNKPAILNCAAWNSGSR